MRPRGSRKTEEMDKHVNLVAMLNFNISKVIYLVILAVKLSFTFFFVLDEYFYNQEGLCPSPTMAGRPGDSLSFKVCLCRQTPWVSNGDGPMFYEMPNCSIDSLHC